MPDSTEPPETKICATCKKAKPLNKFDKKQFTADGLRYSCRECANARLRRYRLKRDDPQLFDDLQAWKDKP